MTDKRVKALIKGSRFSCLVEKRLSLTPDQARLLKYLFEENLIENAWFELEIINPDEQWQEI